MSINNKPKDIERSIRDLNRSLTNYNNDTPAFSKVHTRRGLQEADDLKLIIEGTYSELKVLSDSGKLVKGQQYLMTDYQTIYDQPDYDNTGTLKGTLTLKTEVIEPLILIAANGSSFHTKVISTVYPKDVLKYDINIEKTFYSNSTMKGRIIERIDEWGNRTDYDHRTVKFIRYDNGSGVYNVISDNGNQSQEFLTFGNNYGISATITNNYIGDVYKLNSLLGINLPNNVFLANTFMVANKIGVASINNTWGDGSFGNTWGFFNEGNTWGNDNRYNTWGDVNEGNTWGNDNRYNTWGDNNGSNTWGNDNRSNTWGNDNRSNTWGFFNEDNTWENDNVGNTWGDGSFGNTWGFFNEDNTWGNGNVGNTWGDGSFGNTFANKLQDNIFSNNLQDNIFSNKISNKDFTLVSYLYSKNYEVKVITANDGNVYGQYFDGTNTITTLIP